MRIFEIIIVAVVSLVAFWVIFKNIKGAYRGETCSSCSAECKYRDRCKIQ